MGGATPVVIDCSDDVESENAPFSLSLFFAIAIGSKDYRV